MVCFDSIRSPGLEIMIISYSLQNFGKHYYAIKDVGPVPVLFRLFFLYIIGNSFSEWLKIKLNKIFIWIFVKRIGFKIRRKYNGKMRGKWDTLFVVALNHSPLWVLNDWTVKVFNCTPQRVVSIRTRWRGIATTSEIYYSFFLLQNILKPFYGLRTANLFWVLFSWLLNL